APVGVIRRTCPRKRGYGTHHLFCYAALAGCNTSELTGGVPLARRCAPGEPSIFHVTDSSVAFLIDGRKDKGVWPAHPSPFWGVGRGD
ncbi:MAG: hypothetical protein V3V75_04690, partial [Thermoguttaceae bacterium]